MSKDKLTKREKKLAKGSIYDVAERRNERPEDILAEADVIVVLDESGSMRGDKHEKAVKNLRLLQEKFPGRVLLVSFSDTAKFHFNGLPKGPGGGTSADLPLELIEEFGQLPDTKIYFISDGHPTQGSGLRALKLAKEFKAPINTIFIGSETDTQGQDFLAELAQVSGGENRRRIKVDDMEANVSQMLLTDGKDE